MSIKPTSIPTKTLAASINASALAFRLNNIVGWDGTDLVAGDLGSQAFCVFRNAARTQIEIMEIDPSTIASASITILKRGLDFTGDLTTEITANKLTWVKGDTFVDLGTDTPQLWQWLKEYIDGIAIAGAPDSSTTIKGLSKISVAPVSAASPISVGDNDPRVPTTGENDALAGGSTFGTPSSSNKFITQDYNSSATGIPVVRTYLNAASPATWTKPAGLKYIIVEGVGAGAQASVTNSGGGGGYFKKLIAAASLGATETVTIGATGNPAGDTSFGSHATGRGGGFGGVRGTGGTATGGDVNIQGGDGIDSGSGGTGGNYGVGGQSQLGHATSQSKSPRGYGTGAAGENGGGTANGTEGIVIVTEYYS